MKKTTSRITIAAGGVLAGSALCLIMAGPASADTTTPSPLPSAPTVAATPVPSTPVAAPTPASTGPASSTAPISVPAGNARTTPAGSDATAITLLGAGGVLVAGAGLLAARRRA